MILSVDESEVETFLLNVLATRYVSAAALVCLLYDHLLTLADEVEYVWKAKWSLPKVLFLVIRYMVPIAMIIHTFQLSGLANVKLSDNFCRGWLDTSLYLGIFAIGIGNFIVLLRLWVIWERNARLLVFTMIVFVVTQLATLAAATSLGIRWIPKIIFLDEFRLCGSMSKPPLVGIWAPGLVFEGMVFILAAWNALSRPHTVCPVVYSVYRDGLGYFTILTVLRIVNLVLTGVAPLSLMFLGIFFTWAATTVTVTRLVLNFRRLSALYHEPTQEERPALIDGGTAPDVRMLNMDKNSGSVSTVVQEGDVEMCLGAEEYELRENSSARTITE